MMLSQSCSSSFRFTGVSSSSKVLLSHKEGNNVDPEVGLLLHNEGCLHEGHPRLIRLKQLSVQEERDNKGHHPEEIKQQRSNSIVKKPVRPINVKLEIPSLYVGSDNDDDPSNHGCKTPTSSDHKIPVILECPGAPKKTKSGPARKRKACGRIVLDMSKELESSFPIPCMVDLGDGGCTSKRVKQYC